MSISSRMRWFDYWKVKLLKIPFSGFFTFFHIFEKSSPRWNPKFNFWKNRVLTFWPFFGQNGQIWPNRSVNFEQHCQNKTRIGNVAQNWKHLPRSKLETLPKLTETVKIDQMVNFDRGRCLRPMPKLTETVKIGQMVNFGWKYIKFWATIFEENWSVSTKFLKTRWGPNWMFLQLASGVPGVSLIVLL